MFKKTDLVSPCRHRLWRLHASAAVPKTAVIATLLVAAPVFAAPTSLEGETEDGEPAITNSEAAAACAWPTTVSIDFGGWRCTGTLVHPEIVTYASHCSVSGNVNIKFGETAGGAGGTVVQPEYCMTHPSFAGTASTTGWDFAFCKLPAPVDMPVTPPLMGCEFDALVPGADVAIVGFGRQTLNGGSGTKRWAMSKVDEVNTEDNWAKIGFVEGSSSACEGDSGGPGFIRLADGGWRTFGSVSGSTAPCGQGSVFYPLTRRAVPWIEEQSGIDITPCFTAEGEWDPSPECGGFNASEPNEGFGDWGTWCEGGPVSASSDSCGPPHDAEPDNAPPDVAIVMPENETVYPSAPAMIDVVVSASDEGWGVDDVRLLIDGDDVAGDSSAPFEFNDLTFAGEGVYELRAVATDKAGNTATSDPVYIGVVSDDFPDVPAGEDSSSTESDGSAGSEDGSGGELGTGEDDGPAQDDGANTGGCACGTVQDGPDGWAALALISLLGLIRRRGAVLEKESIG